MAYNGFAIDEYLDAEAVTRQLDELIRRPVYSIRRDKLADYVQHYFAEKCQGSKAMITRAKTVIPGGVQHNLAFNYPFPIVITRAEGPSSMISTATGTTTCSRQGVPPSSAATRRPVREQVIDPPADLRPLHGTLSRV